MRKLNPFPHNHSCALPSGAPLAQLVVSDSLESLQKNYPLPSNWGWSTLKCDVLGKSDINISTSESKQHIQTTNGADGDDKTRR